MSALHWDWRRHRSQEKRFDGSAKRFDPHFPQRNENLRGERQAHARSTDDDDVCEFRIEIFCKPPRADIHQDSHVGKDDERYAYPDRRCAQGKNRTRQKEYYADSEQVNVRPLGQISDVRSCVRLRDFPHLLVARERRDRRRGGRMAADAAFGEDRLDLRIALDFRPVMYPLENEACGRDRIACRPSARSAPSRARLFLAATRDIGR